MKGNLVQIFLTLDTLQSVSILCWSVIVLILLVRRLWRIAPEQALFTISDITLLVLVVTIPFFVALTRVGQGFGALRSPGVDGDYAFYASIDEAFGCCRLILIALVLFSLASVIQVAIREFRLKRR